MLECSERRFGQVNDDLINTKANLNFEVFTDICLVCGLSVTLFQDNDTFIDVILLKRRNAIAHGEDTLIAFTELDEIAEKTIGLMRSFGNELENRVVLQMYKVAQTPN